MSETGALFDPGFLGGGFNWWIGQVMDDTQWRDNIKRKSDSLKFIISCNKDSRFKKSMD